MNSYLPGWDCHGLPIENKALQDLKVSITTMQAMTNIHPNYNIPFFVQEEPHSLLASTIRSAARKTAEREMKIQREEFEQFGIMADWNKESTYRTLGNDIFEGLLWIVTEWFLDHQYEMRQLRIFQQMVSKGSFPRVIDKQSAC